MILKPYQLSNLKEDKFSFFLLYGQNEGQKSDAIHQILKSENNENVYRYDEDELLNNYANFVSEISNKSFFEDKKIVVISRVTEKILTLFKDVEKRKIEDIKIIINSKQLDKKSKLRSNFEKEKDLVCIAFYNDENITLANIAEKFFTKNKIPVSREMLNLLVERCRGDRINLRNELSKIESYMIGKNKISIDEIVNLTNLAENYSFSELADSCLSNNRKKTLLIINENSFSSEDCVTIVRILLSKAKRIFALKTMQKENKSIDECITIADPNSGR